MRHGLTRKQSSVCIQKPMRVFTCLQPTYPTWWPRKGATPINTTCSPCNNFYRAISIRKIREQHHEKRRMRIDTYSIETA
ncbi:hypothetical protein FGO68_gene6203 [Halteria grandinella]|uniref:Uncharacterized protein n=1 Tax=Halteria grandinella TaxID=5974 RepID=A0A8J8NI00_HALGN|nr:hypothetical protein FGO68_gene6203 [Halteria grandinella]